MRQTPWLRPTQITKKFPSNIYSFSQHLTSVGDWVETNPITKEEAIKMNKASHAWSYYHKCTISISVIPAADDLVIVKITLTSKHRNRDYA